MRQLTLATLLLIAVSSACALETTLHKKRRPETLNFRIAAVAERTPRSSFAVNAERYLAYVVWKNGQTTAAKVVFRYSGLEEGLSDEFVDYDLVHSFKAIRDRSCDETWGSFSTKVVPLNDHFQSLVATEFVSSEAVQTIPGDRVLPCYVIRPQDYKKSERIRGSETKLSALASK